MRRQQAQRQRLTDDVLNLPRFVDLPSDDQRVAIRHRSGECADDASIPSCRKHPNDRHVMDDIIQILMDSRQLLLAGQPATKFS
jgi:hypothetical protein